MADVVFDTLGLARRLRERAGFSPEHAEETAQAIAETMVGQVVTNADLTGLRSAIRSDFAEFKAATNADFGAFKGAMSTEFAEFRATANADLAEFKSATKADFSESRSATKADFSELRSATKADLAELKSELTRLVLTVATGQVALLLAAMFSLARLGR